MPVIAFSDLYVHFVVPQRLQSEVIVTVNALEEYGTQKYSIIVKVIIFNHFTRIAHPLELIVTARRTSHKVKAGELFTQCH